MSLAEIAYSGWSFASLTLQRKVEEGPRLLVVFVVVAAVLEEEHMACSDQQHSGKEGQAVVVVEDLPISDLDDSSNLDYICCLKGHNYLMLLVLLLRGSIINVCSIGFRLLIDSRLLQRRTKICMVICRRT